MPVARSGELAQRTVWRLGTAHGLETWHSARFTGHGGLETTHSLLGQHAAAGTN